jgi:hypothetical protein
VAGLLSSPNPSEELNAGQMMVDDVPGVHYGMTVEPATTTLIQRLLCQRAVDLALNQSIRKHMVNPAIRGKQTG